MGAVVLLGLSINVYLALRPERVREQVRRQLDAISGGSLHVEGEIRVDWQGGIRLADIVFRPPGPVGAGDELAAGLRIREAHLEPRRGSLLGGTLEFESVTLIEPHLSLVFSPGGDLHPLPVPPDCALARWLAGALARDPDRPGTPGLHVREGSITFRSTLSDGGRQDFRDVDLDLSLEASGRLALRGQARTPFIDQVRLEGTWDPVAAGLELEFSGARIQLGHPVAGLVPAGARRWIESLDLQGAVDLDGDLVWKPGQLPSVGEVRGKLLDGHLRLPGVPGALERIAARFRLSGSDLTFRDLEAWLGAGRITGSGGFRWNDSWTELVRHHLDLRGEGLDLDTRWEAWLPDTLAELLDRLHLRGKFSFRLSRPEAVTDPAAAETTLRLDLEEGEVLHRDFPLPFRDLRGSLEYSREELRIVKPVTARRGSARATLTGRVNATSAGAPASIDLTLENLPLDESLRAALPPTLVSAWRELHPEGAVQLAVALRRGGGEAPSGEPELSVTIGALDGVIRPESFPLEISRITGKVRLDLLAGRIELLDLRGLHEGQVLHAGGDLETREEGLTGTIRLRAPSLALDRELLEILPADSRSLVQELGLSGRAGVNVDLDLAAGRGVRTRLELEVQDLSVTYARFPLPLRFRSGKVIREPGGELHLEDVRTSAEGPATGSVSGTLRTLGGQRRVDLRLAVDRLLLDDEFPRHLPADLRALVGGLKLGGEVSGQLVCELDYDRDRPRQGRVSYRAREVRASDLSLDFGLAMQGIRARGEFKGGREFEGRHHLRGRATVEASRFNRLRFGATDLEFALGRELEEVRRLRRQPPPEEAGVSPPLGEGGPGEELLLRFGRQPDAGFFQVRVKRSDLYGGILEGYLGLDTGVRGDFLGEFWSREVKVSRAASDVFELETAPEEVSGEARGRVEFSGLVGEPESLRGAGRVRVREARLGTLPLLASFLNRLFSLRAGALPHFKEVDLDFIIEGGKFEARGAESIAIRADGLDFIGSGSMAFDGTLDLTLKPRVFNWSLPVVDSVFDLLKRLLLRIRVGGTLSRPTTRVVSGAGLLQLDVTPERASPKTPAGSEDSTEKPSGEDSDPSGDSPPPSR